MKMKNKRNNKEALKRELTSLENNLLKTLEERLGRIQATPSSRSAEFLDTVSSSELDELAARLVESDSMKLDEIEEALQRLRDGKYGVCSECGDRISRKRLKARPFATLCIDCKQEVERKSGSSNTGSRHSPYTEPVDLGSGGDSGFENAFEDTVRGNRL